MAQGHLAPTVVDALFAAASAVLGIAVLHWLEELLTIKLFEPKMLGSIVVFCSNPSPPSPRAFLVCTACAFAAGLVLHCLGPMVGASRAGNAIAVGLHILLSKLTSNNFSASVGLAAHVATKPWESVAEPLEHLVTPWLAGHTLLYIFALAMSVPRKAARVHLAMREWRIQHGAQAAAGQAVTHARLRELFDRADTSGDGCIDATEFKVVYRSLAYQDLPLSDCEDIIRAFDADGSGKIEFSEFCDAVAPFTTREKKQ